MKFHALKLLERLFQWSTGRLSVVSLPPDFSLEIEPRGQYKDNNHKQNNTKLSVVI